MQLHDPRHPHRGNWADVLTITRQVYRVIFTQLLWILAAAGFLGATFLFYFWSVAAGLALAVADVLLGMLAVRWLNRREEREARQRKGRP